MNRLLNPTHVKISPNTAIERTLNWRNFINNVFKGFTPNKIPKGIYISKKDIEALAKYCSNPSVCGVRAYFTLKNDYILFPNDNEIRFIMVPVAYDNEYFNGKDILQGPIFPEDELSEVSGDDSNVYDFTVPCPDCCDITSPLYGG